MEPEIKKAAEVTLALSQEYYEACNALNRSAKTHFEKRQWPIQRETNRNRLRLIEDHAHRLADSLPESMGRGTQMESSWLQVREWVIRNPGRIPLPVLYGFLRKLETRLGLEPTPVPDLRPFHESDYDPVGTAGETTPPYFEFSRKLLQTPGWQVPFPYWDKDCAFLQESLAARLGNRPCRYRIIPELFYRNQHAYLIGELDIGEERIPFAVPFVNEEIGIRPNAFLAGQQALVRLFEFTRSYFLVNTADPAALVAFLLGLMPGKDPAQLIINLGYQEWGKLLIQQKVESLWPDLSEPFDYTPGVPGMVMIVFSHPGSDLVFKAIRDIGKPPKSIRSEQVVERYQFVADQDRVGRFADAQLFENWRFPRRALAPGLVEELLREARSTVTITDEDVFFHKILTEKQMTPLDLYLQRGELPDAKRAIEDYGRAITEIAMSNIFPGDLLLKNFGVTEDRKVVFYDYDEVCRLSDCRFRKLPQPLDPDDPFSEAVPSHVGPFDVFPEEFRHFLVPQGPLRKHLEASYHHLFHPDFWNRWKQFHLDGGFIDLQPYDEPAQPP